MCNPELYLGDTIPLPLATVAMLVLASYCIFMFNPRKKLSQFGIEGVNEGGEWQCWQ